MNGRLARIRPGLIGGFFLGSSLVVFSDFLRSSPTSPGPDRLRPPVAVENIAELVGNTPLIEISSLSRLTGRRIFAKCEFLNPGQSVKDRPAREMMEDAERQGRLIKNQPGIIIEATGGNTGVAIALLALQRGYSCHLFAPSSISPEKIAFMESLGAAVHLRKPVDFNDKENHYYHAAEREFNKLRAENPEIPCVFMNQFENPANFLAHYKTTGPEIQQQIKGLGIEKLDGFISSAGTGGTIAGISKYFKEKNPAFRSFLIDCSGSGLYEFVKRGKFLSQGSSISEGIGIGRLTQNFAVARPLIEDSYRGSDEEIIQLAYYLRNREGIFLGPSATLNVLGVLKIAEQFPPGAALCTILCDSGTNYRQTLWNSTFLKGKFPHLREFLEDPEKLFRGKEKEFLATLMKGEEKDSQRKLVE